MPDMSEVRRQVDAVLSAEDEPAPPPVIPAPRRQPGPAVPRDTPGMVPPNPRAGWPRSPAARQLPGLRPRSDAVARPLPEVQKVRDQRKPQGSGMGISAIVVLVLVFIGIVVVALSSLVNMVSDLFQ